LHALEQSIIGHKVGDAIAHRRWRLPC